MRHSPLEPWYATLVVGQEIDIGAQSGTDHIDVLRPDARSHDETILQRHQIHERCAGADHATEGMNPQFGYHAVLGRPDRRSQELIVGRLQSLAYLKNLVLRLAQRLRDLVLPVTLQFEKSCLRFVDDLLGARDLCDNFTPPPLDVSHFPLEVQKARAPLKALVNQHGNRLRFLADDFDAPRGRAFLRPEALDFLFNLRPFFPIDGGLRWKDLPTRFEDALLGRQDGRDGRTLVLHHLQLGRKRYPLEPMLFGLQPCFSRHRVPQLALQALDFGAGLGVLQRDQCLPSADNITVRDQNFPDDAALKVLDRFPARLRFHDAGSYRSALKRREARPRSQTKHKAEYEQIACQGDPAKPRARRGRRRNRAPGKLKRHEFVDSGNHAPEPTLAQKVGRRRLRFSSLPDHGTTCSADIFAAVPVLSGSVTCDGTWARLKCRSKISSLSPNAVTVPSCMMAILFVAARIPIRWVMTIIVVLAIFICSMASRSTRSPT